ncbi:hypothetical protein [Halostagnicola sp. A56]|uniref:hypothetical protein n=1 Tax=Halostagnicola sp. A56 TaxID=1495067 RepID=UPI001E4EEFC3|nr:hypothetical protein [Halostagnicola sp. A56]
MTDSPEEKQDEKVAEHILQTNYAGQLSAQQGNMESIDVSQEVVEDQLEEVTPEISPKLLRKYIAYSRINCHPRFTEEAREKIKEFYVDIRSKVDNEDQPVPVSARKLEGLVRLAEASARIRLSDHVSLEDAERVVKLARSCFRDIGIDPEIEETDIELVESGTSNTHYDRVENVKQLISKITPCPKNFCGLVWVQSISKPMADDMAVPF